MDQLQYDQFLRILKKHQEGKASPEETDFLAAYYQAFSLRPSFTASLSEESRNELRNELYKRIGSQTTKNKRLWPRIAVAIAVAVMIFGAGMFIYKSRQSEEVEAVVYANDVAPGKNGATLTLANGTKIRLSDANKGELAKQSGITISKTANGQLVYEQKSSAGIGTDLSAINTLSTAKGETYQVRLPDGSTVWLNAASSLNYAANLLQNGKRMVKLTGEGYFEIAKDKSHPFVVESKGQQVEVLGTHFNISSYDDEQSMKTTLLEGKVTVMSSSGAGDVRPVILNPNQQAISSAGRIKVKNVRAEDAIAWKEGIFLFDDEPLEAIMLRIARWYNVEVVYVGNVNKNESFGGGVSRYDNVSKILENLQATNTVHFKIEGRKIFVMK